VRGKGLATFGIGPMTVQAQQNQLGGYAISYYVSTRPFGVEVHLCDLGCLKPLEAEIEQVVADLLADTALVAINGYIRLLLNEELLKA